MSQPTQPVHDRPAPLAGLRVIESSLLGPAAITTHLADLGAEVIKVESPSGDYVREMTWPIVEGTSLLHLHINRGKRSLVLDLRVPEAVEVYLELVRGADVVIEAHLFDFADDIYDQPLRVALVDYLRPEKKFAGVNELKAQIAEDCDAARALLESISPGDLRAPPERTQAVA